MQIKYRVIVRDGRIEEEQYFEGICCEDMRKALTNQKTTLAKEDTIPWLYCPFCKEKIEY